MEKRLKHWTAALEESNAEAVRASDLYCGDSWSTIRSAVGNAPPGQSVNWWIASAGYGLIGSPEMVVPYSATFTRGHADSVVRANEAPSTRQKWWDGLCAWRRSRRRSPSSIQQLASKFPKHPLLVALSAEYLGALEGDLLGARDALADPDRLVIVSAGARKDGDLALNCLPCDARLEHLLGGVRGSLNARIVRHIFATTPSEKIRMSHLRELFEKLLRRQPAARFIERQRLDDGQLIEFIADSFLQAAKPSHSGLLRALRARGLACEQKRFRALFLETEQALISQS
jgi:hypothetical protein